MMLESRTTEFLEELASAKPVPGGGGASAAAGAFAAALGRMVSNLTVGKKKYADVEEEICAVCAQLESLQGQLVRLTDADAEAFAPLAAAYRMPKETEEQRAKKERVMEQALLDASEAPLQIMETVFQVIGLMEVLGEKGSRMAVSDVGVGVLLAQAALEGASLNVFINTKLMKDRARAERLNGRAEELICQGRKQTERIYAGVAEQIK